MKSLKYDEIGYWSEVKIDIVRQYASAYSTILNKQRLIKKHVYVDAFAGAGQHISKKTGEFVAGSPRNALLIHPPFNEYHLIDLDRTRAAQLRKDIGDQQGVYIYEGGANKILLSKVFPRCKYEDFHRALVLLDPYALNVDWKVIETAGKMGSVEVFYNFMIMDANMNILWRDPSKVAANQAARMDKVWGDHTWRDAAYQKKQGLFDEFEEKANNEAVAEAFRVRLRKVAGFGFVPKPIPMRNEKGAIIYYLFFASPNKTGAHIVEDIFTKYRTRGI